MKDEIEEIQIMQKTLKNIDSLQFEMQIERIYQFSKKFYLYWCYCIMFCFGWNIKHGNKIQKDILVAQTKGGRARR